LSGLNESGIGVAGVTNFQVESLPDYLLVSDSILHSKVYLYLISNSEFYSGRPQTKFAPLVSISIEGRNSPNFPKNWVRKRNFWNTPRKSKL
jgi:hypothetical protein